MEIGIVGLPRSGKTTIFNAVTRGKAQVATFSGSRQRPNLGVTKVSDARLDALEDIFKPKRKVSAEVTYVDIPAAPEGLGTTWGISGEFLNHLQRTDALLLVARAFEDPSVPAAQDAVDPFRDVETMVYELAFADLEVVDRRLARIAEGSKGAKAAEREAVNKEHMLLTGLKTDLDGDTPMRERRFAADEARILGGFKFLTAKPLIIVVNAGEDQVNDLGAVAARLSSEFKGPRVRVTVLCGSLEMELAHMGPADEREFRDSLELGESGLARVIGLSHDVLDVITFFTGNSNEVRAWTIPKGSTVLEAAGGIHSDFERGFIRAEVVPFDDLARCGTIAEARRQAVLRQEGKAYVVCEGDVVNVLFNV